MLRQGFTFGKSLSALLMAAKIDRVKVSYNEAVLEEPTKLPKDNNGYSTKGFSTLFASRDTGWSWEPPSLSPGKKWYKGSLRQLKEVVSNYCFDEFAGVVLTGSGAGPLSYHGGLVPCQKFF